MKITTSPARKMRKWPKRKALKRRSKRKSVRKDIWGTYGIKRPVYVRYSGLAGVLWWVMSQYVRQSEFKEFGVCIDGCGIPITDWRECDCGHLKSSTKLSTRFRRENLGLQRKWCNSPYGGAGNSVGFAKTVDERYGAGTALELEKLSQQRSEPLKKEWIDAQIRHYLALINSLPTQ